jgi:homoserine kinase type II
MARGLIHGDIFWDNLIFKKGTLTAVLDFEETCHYFLLFDLGMAAVGCCSAEGRFQCRKRSPGCYGATKTAALLTDSEKAQFVPFLVYAATATAFWRFRQYNLRYPDLNYSRQL